MAEVSYLPDLKIFIRESQVSARKIALILVSTMLFTITEGAGIGLMLPVLRFVSEGMAGMTETPARQLVKALTAIGLPVNMLTLLVVALIPFLLRQWFFFHLNLTTAIVRANAEKQLRQHAIAVFLAAPLGFYIRRSRGEVSSSLFNDVSRAGGIVTAVVDATSALGLLTIYFVIALAISWQLTLLAIPIFLAASLFFRFTIRRGAELGVRLTGLYGDLGRHLNETFHAIKLIKLRNAEQSVGGKLNVLVAHLVEVSIDTRRNELRLNTMMQPVLVLCVFVLLYIAVTEMQATLADLGVFLLLMMRAIPLVIQINTQRLMTAHAITAFRNLRDLRDQAASQPRVNQGSRPFRQLEKAITFERVGFRHDAGEHGTWTLRDVSFTVTPGTTLALVGRSGAGKSTIADLIARFHEPAEGSILLDDVPLQEYDLGSFRSRIALVNQDQLHFNDTVRANLAFGLPEGGWDDDFLIDCLKAAHAWEFVQNLPQGMDTPVGEQGMRLSGGQRQRLAIARALAQRPEILILDEPTSALDSQSEAVIQETLQEIHGRLTVIVIAHRLSTIKDADHILVLENGRIIEQGRHEQLIQAGGTYGDLFRHQQVHGDSDAPLSE